MPVDPTPAMDLTSLDSKLAGRQWGVKLKKIAHLPFRTWEFIKRDPRTMKRIAKCAVTLSGAIALTIHHPLVDIWGTNPFLLGTTAIYLFPKQSVGAQIVATTAALTGALFGIAYSNLILFLARLIQPSAPDGYISEGRRAILWTFFVISASICGYMRSKFPRIYLSTIFAMIVNMFALIRGISDFGFVFRRFFVVMVVGAAFSMIVSLCLWPEDYSEVLRGNMESALAEARQVILEVEKSIWTRGYAEVDAAQMGAAVKKLAASFKESHYEISLSRVDARDLVGLSGKLETLLDLIKVYNCTMRTRPMTLSIPTPNVEASRNSVDEEGRGGPASEEKTDMPTTPTTEADVTKRRAISFALLDAVRVLDMISDRVKDAYDSKNGTRSTPETFLGVSGFEKTKETVETVLLQERERRSDVDIVNLGVEGVAFVDLLGTIIVEILETVHGAARASGKVTSTGRLKLFLPIKFRKAEKSDAHTRSQFVSHFVNDVPEYDEFDEGHDDDEEDDEDSDDTATELVLLRPEEKWYTSLAQGGSRVLSRIKHSRHVKYGIKFAIVMGILSSPAYIGKNYIWYENLRVQWALISAMVAMETTRGMTFRTAGMKVCGAVMGGISAFITMHITQGYEWGSVVVALFLGILIGYLVNNATLVKAGTVFALAFNIIIGVAHTSTDHNTTAALARRLITLPIGLLVAMIVHVGFFPFHARAQLGRAISTSMDWLHHLLYAIELAGDDNAPLGGGAGMGMGNLRIVSEEQFAEVVMKTKRRVRFANGLLPATRYEISLAGHFPVEKFEKILERLGEIVLLIVGTGNIAESGPVLLDPRFRGKLEAYGRDQLLGSLCNDLLVLSHTLSARLYMPRHNSHSAIVLSDYISLFTPTVHPPSPHTPSPSSATFPASTSASPTQRPLQIQFTADSRPNATSTANYADVGRLATLVNEMNLLREEVDNLITESHVTPRAKEAFPQLSASVLASASASRCASRSQLHLDFGFDGGRLGAGRTGSRNGSRGPSRNGSRAQSRAGSRSGSRAGTPLASPRKPEAIQSRSRGGERWGGGCGKGRDPGHMV